MSSIGFCMARRSVSENGWLIELSVPFFLPTVMVGRYPELLHQARHDELAAGHANRAGDCPGLGEDLSHADADVMAAQAATSDMLATIGFSIRTTSARSGHWPGGFPPGEFDPEDDGLDCLILLGVSKYSPHRL